jgi:hypothetical protein
MWIECDLCENPWCTEHNAHAFECPCDPIEEQDGDPYG